MKGWVDKGGKTQERTYNVAVSGGRKIDADGRCKTPVGSTVDVEAANWTNTIGAPELITVWKDPQSEAKQRAFYYARVIEIPTPRWTAYDAKRFGIKPLLSQGSWRTRAGRGRGRARDWTVGAGGGRGRALELPMRMRAAMDGLVAC